MVPVFMSNRMDWQRAARLKFAVLRLTSGEGVDYAPVCNEKDGRDEGKMHNDKPQVGDEMQEGGLTPRCCGCRVVMQ